MFKHRNRKANIVINAKLNLNTKFGDIVKSFQKKKDEYKALVEELIILRKKKENFTGTLPLTINILDKIIFTLKAKYLEERITEIEKELHNEEEENHFFINIIDLYYGFLTDSNSGGADGGKKEVKEREEDTGEDTGEEKKKMGAVPLPPAMKPRVFWKKSNDEMSRISTQKNAIIIEFFRRVDPEFLINHHYQEVKHLCDKCGIERVQIQNDGILVCLCCGSSEEVLIDTIRQKTKDRKYKENCSFTYKKIGHFNEWINRFEAKKIPRIPDIVFEDIQNEIKKARIVDISKIKPKMIRQYLKKLGYNEYYEDVSYILSQLTNIVPPTLSKNEKERLRLMFREVEIAWKMVKPDERNNFINYPFVFRKLLELLGYDMNYLNYFMLSESNEKLMTMDNYWHAVCNILKYEFIPSRRVYKYE